MKCHYCGRERMLPCQNTRDMTDFAITGEDTCLDALGKIGWGESGEQYVKLNREAWEERLARL